MFNCYEPLDALQQCIKNKKIKKKDSSKRFFFRMEIPFRTCCDSFSFSNKNKMFNENVNPIPIKKIYFKR